MIMGQCFGHYVSNVIIICNNNVMNLVNMELHQLFKSVKILILVSPQNVCLDKQANQIIHTAANNGRMMCT